MQSRQREARGDKRNIRKIRDAMVSFHPWTAPTSISETMNQPAKISLRGAVAHDLESVRRRAISTGSSNDELVPVIHHAHGIEY